jgi:hypothetical protein
MIATMKSQKIDHYRQALKEGRITQQEYDAFVEAIERIYAVGRISFASAGATRKR